ncbi:MAG: hypothetical protein H7270_15790 [Dermatophilaceae bacterium]|nr:hypothetical protein [Dermatophilaceae bacterium]
MSDDRSATAGRRPVHLEGDPGGLRHDRDPRATPARHRPAVRREQAGARRRAFSDLADALGVDFGAPPDGHPDGSEVGPDDDTALDAASASLIQQWCLLGDAALRVMAPRQNPILWPEHFDVAILLDDTSYGVSPGDALHAAPYAYVSSSDHDDSDFLNAPFGAIRSYEQMRSINDLVIFWSAAQGLLATHG